MYSKKLHIPYLYQFNTYVCMYPTYVRVNGLVKEASVLIYLSCCIPPSIMPCAWAITTYTAGITTWCIATYTAIYIRMKYIIHVVVIHMYVHILCVAIFCI